MLKQTDTGQIEKKLVSDVTRRLGGLVTAPIRCIPDRLGEAPIAKRIWSGQWVRAELIAARHYEDLGYEIIRLDHWTAGAVGHECEPDIKGASQLGTAMRRVLPTDVYAVWIARNSYSEEGLTGAYPENYPIAGYVPDFLIARQSEWRFVEVKGPGDVLHRRQANWLINLRPTSWPYEICAPVRNLSEPIFLKSSISMADGFLPMIAEWHQEANDYRVMVRVRAEGEIFFKARNALERLPRKQKRSQQAINLIEEIERGRVLLIAAEDRHAEVCARFWTRIHTALKRPPREWLLDSERLVSAVDPNWTMATI